MAKEELQEGADVEDLLAKSKRRWAETYKNLKPVNDDPEAMTLGADEAAILAAKTKED